MAHLASFVTGWGCMARKAYRIAAGISNVAGTATVCGRSESPLTTRRTVAIVAE